MIMFLLVNMTENMGNVDEQILSIIHYKECTILSSNSIITIIITFKYWSVLFILAACYE